MDTKKRHWSWTQQQILRKLNKYDTSGVAMAAGGTLMAGDKMESAMSNLGIQGQGFKATLSQDGHLRTSSSATSPSVSRPTTATSGDPLESLSMPPEAINVIETVINMNKSLEQQIDTLRMRLTVEAKQHDKDIHKVSVEKEKQIELRENEIEDLRDSLVNRDDRITSLVKDSHEKDLHIHNREREISDLKELVKQTETYAEQLQKKITRLKGEKTKSESDPGQKDPNNDIRRLRQEIVSLKDKVNIVEKELIRANAVIQQQNLKMQSMELEKSVLSDKFKAELEKAGRQMRTEVERMREVMKQQYEEMRNLRQQNIEISSDVRDIKDILLNNQVKPELDVKQKNEKIDVNNFKSPRPIQKSPNYGTQAPLTSRQTNVPKANQTVRSSLPTSLNQNTMAFPSRGLPPITREQTGRWVPAGTGTKQSTLHVKTPRDRRK